MNRGEKEELERMRIHWRNKMAKESGWVWRTYMQVGKGCRIGNNGAGEKVLLHNPVRGKGIFYLFI
jgi:hypothetical protein